MNTYMDMGPGHDCIFYNVGPRYRYVLIFSVENF